MPIFRRSTRPDRTTMTALLFSAFALAACADAGVAPLTSERSTPAASVSPISSARVADDGSDVDGAVYTLTNAASGNGVIAFHRAPDGTLSPLGTFATGGRGTGGTVDPLVSQYAVIVSERHDALFAVDAGSNQLSSFRVGSGGALTLVGTVASGGTRPISVAAHGNLLYALNGGDNTVSGFRVTGGAGLVALPNTTRSLASGAAGAAAIRFTPDGDYLIVSERVSNRFEVFPVLPNGRLGAPVISSAVGGASFGFDITSHNQPIVSETQGSVSSYALGAAGALAPITGSIATGGAAPCWVTITSDGRFAYVTNSASNFISGFAISAAGSLTSLTPGTATGSSGAGAIPIDLDHVGSRFLYTLEAGQGTIGRFTIAANGSLTAGSDTPAGAGASGLQGLAAY